MGDYSQMFQDDPELLNRALSSFESAHPESIPPSRIGADNGYGALEQGNIDLTKRPHVRNQDGSVSTVRSIGVNVDGREVLIPTVSDDGRVMSDNEAVNEYQRTGRHLGVYSSPDASTRAAEAIHRDQEANPPENVRTARAAERPRGSLGQQQRQLTDERVDSANQTADSYQREGDAKADASARAAQIYAQQAQVADRYAAAAERRYNDDQERGDHYKRLVDEDFERLRQEPPKPGRMKNAFNVITGIIGAAAGGSTRDALGMLGAFVNRSAEEDAQERVAAKGRIDVAQKIHDSILDDSQNEFDASAKLVANQWMVASRQLEQVSNESNVPAFREQALRLSIAARDQARGILEQNVNAQIQQRAASMRTRWEGMTQQELEALQKAGVLPVEAAERLAKLQKLQRDASGADSPNVALKQEAAKSLRLYEAAEKDVGTMRDTIAKLKAKGSDDVPGVGPLAGHVGNWAISAEGVKLRGAVKRVLNSMLRDESGAALGDKEIENYMEARGMSPTATNTDFLAGMKAVVEEYEGKRAIAREAAGKGPGEIATGTTAVDEAAARFGGVPRAKQAGAPAVADAGARPGARY